MEFQLTLDSRHGHSAWSSSTETCEFDFHLSFLQSSFSTKNLTRYCNGYLWCRPSCINASITCKCVSRSLKLFELQSLFFPGTCSSKRKKPILLMTYRLTNVYFPKSRVASIIVSMYYSMLDAWHWFIIAFRVRFPFPPFPNSLCRLKWHVSTMLR